MTNSIKNIFETNTISKINELKSVLDELLPFDKDTQNLLQKKILLEFNYNSNHIEGNTLTYGQTQLLLIHGKTSGNSSIRDLNEMKAHDVAFRYIQERAAEGAPLSELLIRELNEVILKEPFRSPAKTRDDHPTTKIIIPGQYKSSTNSVELKDGSIHEYASPLDTPIRMGELVEWYRENENVIHPVQLAGQFHYKFVNIHPFDDGNGRVARLIMNFILLKSGFPVVIIKSDDKENYLVALQKADLGDISSFLAYIEQQMISSLQLYIKAGKRENIDEPGDIDKEISVLRKRLIPGKLHKTPKLCFEIIKHIQNDIWPPLEKTIEKFGEFFVETSNAIYVNREKLRKYKAVSTFGLPQVFQAMVPKNVEVVKYRIFDKNLEEEPIVVIKWEKSMLSLKSVPVKTDFMINCTLELNESNYNYRIANRNETVFEVQKDYRSLFLNDEVIEITAVTSKYLIRTISELLKVGNPS